MHSIPFFSSSSPNEDPLYFLFASYSKLLRRRLIFLHGLSKIHGCFDFLMDGIDRSLDTIILLHGIG